MIPWNVLLKTSAVPLALVFSVYFFQWPNFYTSWRENLMTLFCLVAPDWTVLEWSGHPRSNQWWSLWGVEFTHVKCGHIALSFQQRPGKVAAQQGLCVWQQDCHVCCMMGLGQVPAPEPGEDSTSFKPPRPTGNREQLRNRKENPNSRYRDLNVPHAQEWETRGFGLRGLWEAQNQ